ncbi:hypothetical protein DL93DRAFT_2085310 [Clavulina sp. PMI_390]|nr:hypothetical protein DL93DRAFT_2085310 [Clavulina sp. PMI_390]
MDSINECPNASPDALDGMPGSFHNIPDDSGAAVASPSDTLSDIGGHNDSSTFEPLESTSEPETPATTIASPSAHIPSGSEPNVLRNRFPMRGNPASAADDEDFDTHDEDRAQTPSDYDSWSSLSRTQSSDQTPSNSSFTSHQPAPPPLDDHNDYDQPPPPSPQLDNLNQPSVDSASDAAPKPAPAEPAAEDEPQCRICLGGLEDCDELGPLIQPCRCTGTISKVHVDCLNSWRNTSASRSAFWECPQCHFKYHFARTRIVGLAESKVALTLMTLLLFTIAIFITSSLISYIFPDILYPELAAERLSRRAASHSSTYYGSTSWGVGFGLGGWNFMTYDLTTLPEVIADFIHFAAAMFLDVDVDVKGLVRAITGSPSGTHHQKQKPRVGGVRGGAGQKYSTGRTPIGSAKRVLTDSQGNVLPSSRRSFLGQIVARFMLGLSTMGIVSFLQLMMSMSLLAPLQMLRGAWYRRRRREGDGGRRGGVEALAGLMIALFVMIGIIRAMQQIYKITVLLARTLLTRFEVAILDVDGNPHYPQRHNPPAANQQQQQQPEVPPENLPWRERMTRWVAERAMVLEPLRAAAMMAGVPAPEAGAEQAAAPPAANNGEGVALG